MPGISKRLKAILEVATPKQNLWDICCDHGELGIEAMQMGLAKNYYFVDRVPSIIQGLNQKLLATDIPKGCTFKTFCEDASKIKRNFSNSTLIIAGIGENTAVEILSQYSFDLESELVLSIHSDNYDLREYLISREFRLLDERILKDKGKFYEILKVSLNPSGETLSLVGKNMWNRQNPVSIELLERKISYLELRLSHQKDVKAEQVLRELKYIQRNLT